MIDQFIYKYYIDPIRYGRPYTIVDTLTYAIILILAVYLLYRGLKRFGILVDHEFVLSTLPFVVLGGLLRVVEDTGMIGSDWHMLLITPIIFFVVFILAVIPMFLGKYLENRGLVDRYSSFYGGSGIVFCLITLAVLLCYGLTASTIDLVVAIQILGLAAATSFILWFFLLKVLKWNYANDILYKLLIFGHMLDASATSVSIDLHPVNYFEAHVAGSAIIEATGTAFSMFALKLVVIIPAIYILEMYRREGGSESLWHLIVLAMIVVGMAPGIRDLVRAVLYV